MCSLFVGHTFTQLVSLFGLQSWIGRRPRRSDWDHKFCQTLRAIHQAGNAVGSSSNLAFCIRIIGVICNDILGKILALLETY